MSQEITVTLSFLEFISVTAALRQRISRLEQFSSDFDTMQRTKNALNTLKAAQIAQRNHMSSRLNLESQAKQNASVRREEAIKNLSAAINNPWNDVKRFLTEFADAIAPVPECKPPVDVLASVNDTAIPAAERPVCPCLGCWNYRQQVARRKSHQVKAEIDAAGL